MARGEGVYASITVRVTPRASRTQIDGFVDQVLKVKLAAPPVNGAANDELVRLFAKTLKVPKSDVEITAGSRSRTKKVRIRGLKQKTVEERIASV